MIRRLAAAIVALALSGCATMDYLLQSATGHLGLMASARPLKTVLESGDGAPALREELERADEIRTFASAVLSLPDNDSYRTFVALDRPYVVWTVVATPGLSLEPQRWCFPVVGCVSYRGYFSKADAERFAAGLAEAGMDVYVAGVRAYSTLGWFDDPLLSSMLGQPAHYLAGVIFHELAHQALYVPDDSAFNESFAAAVERAGVARWIRASGDASLAQAHRIGVERRARFLEIVRDGREELAQIYASALDEEDKRAAKRAAFRSMRARYETVRAGWRDGPSYDRWFEGEPNNAKLALVNTYNHWTRAFEALLAEHGGDLPAFYEASRALARLPREEREAALRRLDGSG